MSIKLEHYCNIYTLFGTIGRCVSCYCLYVFIMMLYIVFLI